MEDEDDLYDDSLLSRRTLPRNLNVTFTSISSRQSGRLSLASRNLASIQNFKVNCASGAFKAPGVNDISKDVNQNVVKLRQCERPERCQRADLAKEPEMPNSQGAGLFGQRNVFAGQESVFTSQESSMKPSQKPSDVLKRKKMKGKGVKIKKQDSEKQIDLESLEFCPPSITLWANPAIKSQEELKETLVDDLIFPKPRFKRKIKRKRRDVGDWSYVEGGSSSDESDKPLNACPIFKRIPGTSFAVDALIHGEDSRISTHFLTRFREENCVKDSAVPIYCSTITAALMLRRCKFGENVLRPLECNRPKMIAGVKVTAIDAHDEPGSAVLLFQLPGNVNIVYTGDICPNATLESFPAFWSPGFVTDYLMTDTRRISDNSRLLREELENRVECLVEACLKRYPKSLVAFVSDGFTEKNLYTALALRLDLKVFAHCDSAATLAAINDFELNDLMTTNRHDATLHIIPETSCTYEDLTARLKIRFLHVTVVNPRKDFEPNHPNDLRPVTDWNITVIDVPTSGGTSFSELKRLVRFLRPKRLVSPIRPHLNPIQTTYFRQWLDQSDPDVVPVPFTRK